MHHDPDGRSLWPLVTPPSSRRHASTAWYTVAIVVATAVVVAVSVASAAALA